MLPISIFLFQLTYETKNIGVIVLRAGSNQVELSLTEIQSMYSLASRKICKQSIHEERFVLLMLVRSKKLKKYNDVNNGINRKSIFRNRAFVAR